MAVPQAELVDPRIDPVQAAMEVFKSGVHQAAQTIVEMATMGGVEKDRTQLTAAQYVVDRVMGRIKDAAGTGDPMDKIVKDILEGKES